jgi:hypothetical protein
LSYCTNLFKESSRIINITSGRKTFAEEYISSIGDYLSQVLERYKDDKRRLKLEVIVEPRFTDLKANHRVRDIDQLIGYLKQVEPGNLVPKKLIGCHP